MSIIGSAFQLFNNAEIIFPYLEISDTEIEARMTTIKA